MKKDGATIVGGRQNWSYLEGEIRVRAPSLTVFKMRADGGSLVLSFLQLSDFLRCVRAAASVNVSTEIGWLFAPKSNRESSIDCCFLRLGFDSNLARSTLELFLIELGGAWIRI